MDDEMMLKKWWMSVGRLRIGGVPGRTQSENLQSKNPERCFCINLLSNM
jgi:hypothetical protein